MQRISAISHHHPLHARRRNLRLPFGTQRFLAALEGIEGGLAVGASMIVALSIAGLWRGYALGMNGVCDGIETAVLGLGIILIGLVSGLVVNSL